MNPSYVYDIETENWTTFVLGGLYDGRSFEAFDHTREREFVTRLASLRGEVYAHNGGRFDHLWLLDAIERYGLQRQGRVIANSSGMIKLAYKGGPTFLDSWRVFPMSLRKLTNGEKESLDDLCMCGLGCGGYCAVRRDMRPPVRARVTSYLRRDCTALWDALSYFGELGARERISFGVTIGGSAWKTIREELGVEDQPFESPATWRYVRSAYYGGRCDAFKRYSPAGFSYDVNSMYPAKIAQCPLPVRFTGSAYGATAARAYAGGVPGVYTATVLVPPTHIPPLPLRMERPWRRMFYPTGRFQGTWTFPELAYAESTGVKIVKIHRAALFAEGRTLFTSWVNRLFALRASFGKASREGAWLKLLMNSLTGKFGSREDMRELLIDPEDIRICTCQDDGEPCSCGAYTALPHSGRLYEREVKRIQPCAHVEWSSYLTSEARIDLHKQLTARGGTDAVYCDTDGIQCEEGRTRDVGSAIGEWSVEGEYRDFIALAPKVYTYWKDGERKVRAKGIPKPDWEKLARGEDTTFNAIAGLRNPVDGKYFMRMARHRKVTPNSGGRIPNGSIDTRPPTVDEVYSMCRS